MEHDLPLVSVTRVAKQALSAKAGLTKEAKDMLQTAASIFVLYLASAADDECKAKGRQTMSSTDVIKALNDIDFSQFATPAAEFLQRSKSNAKKPKKTKAEDVKEDDDNEEEVKENEDEDEAMDDEEETKE